jgi:hypothetical protein
VLPASGFQRRRSGDFFLGFISILI